MRKLCLAALVALMASPAFATVTGNPPPSAYSCNGVTTTYTISFPYLAKTDIVATVTTAGIVSTLALTTDYTVTPAIAPSVGTLVLTAGSKCPNGSTLTISRLVTLTQPTSFRTGAYNGPATELALDRLAMQNQQINAKVANPVSPSALTNATPVTATGSLTPIQLQDWFASATNVKAFGCVGDGIASDTTCITAAIAALPANRGTLFFPPGIYKVNDQFAISKPYTRVVGYGAKLEQSGTLKRSITANAAGIVIEGLWFYNDNGPSEWADSPAGSTNNISVYLDTGCDGCKVMHNRVENFGWSGIRVFQSKSVLVWDNEVIGIGLTKPLAANNNNNLGIELYLSGIGYPGTRVIGNHVSHVAQGLYMGFDWQDVVFAENVVDHVEGQHGMYLGGAVNLVVADNIVDTTGQACIKQQISTDTTLTSENSVFSGNTLTNCGTAGLLVLPSQAGLTPRFNNISAVANTIRNSGTGIDFDHVDNYNIADNSITNTGGIGIRTRTESGSGRVAGNTVNLSQQTGIYTQARTVADLGIVENNYVIDPAQSGAGTSDLRAAISLSTGEWIARHNVMTATNPTPITQSFNVNGTATVTLSKNRTIPNKNNTFSGTLVIDGRTAIGTSNGATLVANAQTTNLYVVTCSVATTVAWTHGPPSNPTSDGVLTYTVRNTSAGALGVLTWDAIFKMAAWVQPSTGTSNSITFRYDGTNWVEVSRTTGVPN